MVGAEVGRYAEKPGSTGKQRQGEALKTQKWMLKAERETESGWRYGRKQ